MIKFLLFLALVGSSALASPSYLTVKIDGPIGEETRNEVLALILKVGTTPNQIWIQIDTPGGRADIMEDMYNTIMKLRDKGHTVNCLIKKAYSAGFAIAAACSQRFAYKSSTLMWHHGWFSYIGPLDVPTTREILESLEKDQEQWDTLVRAGFKASDEAFHYMRDNTLILTAEEINMVSPGYLNIIKEKGKK